MNLTDWRAQFDEFNGVPDAKCQRFLDAAAVQIGASIWGPFGPSGGPFSKADQGHAYLAAHMLVLSPFGQPARMVMKDKEGYDCTTYGQTFKKLMLQKTSGYRITL